MNKMILMAAISCLYSTLNYAQPDITVYPNTGCSGDLEIKLSVFRSGTTTIIGVTNWFPMPSTQTTYDYNSIPPPNGWMLGQNPGAPGAMNMWYFAKAEVRNCEVPAGSTGTQTNCMAGYDYCSVEHFVNTNDCFTYSNASSCGCSPGDEIQVSEAFVDPSGGVSIDDL